VSSAKFKPRKSSSSNCECSTGEKAVKKVESASIESQNNGENNFTTIPLQQSEDQKSSLGSIDISNGRENFNKSANGDNLCDPLQQLLVSTPEQLSKSPSSLAGESDGYSSMSYLGVPESANLNSFGPFMDTLFEQMNNFLQLHPDIILMVTGLVSTLASSRLPLISSLFLDPSMTLQPSYHSFSLTLNRIRQDLDRFLRGNESQIEKVWLNLSKEAVAAPQSSRSSIVHSKSTAFDTSYSSGRRNSPGVLTDNSFTESLKRKIGGGGSLTNALQNMFARKSNFNSSYGLSPSNSMSPNESFNYTEANNSSILNR